MSCSYEDSGARVKRRVAGLTIGGEEVFRTTTLPLSHYWQTQFLCSDGRIRGMSGFASSEELAQKAAASETARMVKRWRNPRDGRVEVKTHIVPVREVAP